MIRVSRWSAAHAAAVFFASVGTVLALSGIASLQASCFKSDSNSTGRRLLETSDSVDYTSVYMGVYSSCSKVYRFQWFGIALEAIFLVVLQISRHYGHSLLGLQIVGSTATTLAVLFANDSLKLYDHTDGELEARASTAFVGFMFVAGGNFGLALLGASESNYIYATPVSGPTALGRPSSAPIGGLASTATPVDGSNAAGASKTDGTEDGAVVAIIAGPSSEEEIVEGDVERV